MTLSTFFDTHYRNLRYPFGPMKWMRRIFEDIVVGRPPSLVDLPTGSGKTDLIVIWLIALAWYGHNRKEAKPISRRLVWVVNRRVLVQQVHLMVEELRKAINENSSAETEELKCGLRKLHGFDDANVLNIVQLRGQRLDDREWSLAPTQAQLIIGTVDQIGSRLLFQGYGQGKWSRPLQAALLGIDSWVCIDEAHLVPAFAVTLRQIREHILKPSIDVPDSISDMFGNLPSWFTELSATPGLCEPRHGNPFRLDPAKGEESDNAIAPRITARTMRRVIWKPLTDQKKLVGVLAEEAMQIAKESPAQAVAVFCRKATDAEKVAKAIGKKQNFPGRVLLVTGRLRGYERDRLEHDERFRRFKTPHGKAMADDAPPSFLVGTSAAEVGLDADASAIVCDFADLITLVQRLGRLDRRGELSLKFKKSNSRVPAMMILGGDQGNSTTRQLEALANRLERSSGNDEFDHNLFTGGFWSVVIGEDKNGHDGAVMAATWQTLDLPIEAKKEEGSDASAPAAEGDGAVTDAPNEIIPPAIKASHPAKWLQHRFAPITMGPVVVPPLSDATLRRWAATTVRPTPHLPVHPWLYGLLPDDDGVPLVGIAFRLELDVLAHCKRRDDESGEPDEMWEKVRAVLTRFPPLRSEFHLAPIQQVREWLEQQQEHQMTLAHYDGENWANEIEPTQLSADTVILLPTSCTSDEVKAMQESGVIPQGTKENKTQPLWDVLEAMADDGARYKRHVEVAKSNIRVSDDDPVYQVRLDADATPVNEDEVLPKPGNKWKPARLKLNFEKGGIAFTLRYWTRNPSNDVSYQTLNDHLDAAGNFAEQLAKTLAPDDGILSKILMAAASHHDLGKDHDKWQRAMGNTRSWRESNELDDSVRVAKPVTDRPANAGGYRHEWGTLMKVNETQFAFLDHLPDTERRFFRDLYLHLIAAHHGFFRPSMPDRGFDSPPTPAKQNSLRLKCIERAARLQKQLGYWRLAYLESLLKVADVAASRGSEFDPLEAANNLDET